MANISLRGLDESTALRLKDEARRRGLSVNALVLQLIRQGTVVYTYDKHFSEVDGLIVGQQLSDFLP